MALNILHRFGFDDNKKGSLFDINVNLPISPPSILVQLWSHSQIHSWNQPVLSKEGKFSRWRNIFTGGCDVVWFHAWKSNIFSVVIWCNDRKEYILISPRYTCKLWLTTKSTLHLFAMTVEHFILLMFDYHSPMYLEPMAVQKFFHCLNGYCLS